MGLETFTGKVSDLVETNPPGTDPKSQGDDHLRGIKKTIIGQAIKTQVGQHATASENHFWDGSVPNELTLKRGTPDVPGAELIKALDGVLSFPSQGQSLVGNGYVNLPGGLIIQWGSSVVTTNALGNATITYPIVFPTSGQPMGLLNGDVATTGPAFIGMEGASNSLFDMRVSQQTGAAYVGAARINWIAIGY